MEQNTNHRVSNDQIKQIHQEEFDIIEKEILQIEIMLKDLEKNPNSWSITYKNMLLKREWEITEKLKIILSGLLQSAD